MCYAILKHTTWLCDGGYVNNKRRKKKKGKKSTVKKVLLSILAVFLILVLGVVLGVAPFIIDYYKNAYDGKGIVERDDAYVMPEQDAQPDEYKDLIIPENQVGVDLASAKEPLPKDENAKGVYGKTPIYKVKQKDPDIENILVIGTDSRNIKKERGRSDSIMIMSLNKKTGQIKIVSILRDSLVPIEGHGWNRINAAYSFDGIGLTVNTINQLFSLDVQRFAVIDFTGAQNFINQVGGVDIKITQAEADYFNRLKLSKKEMKAGLCHMDGKIALQYMRIRKIDSDFKRTARQRNVIQALATQIVEEKTMGEIYYLTGVATEMVRTNIPLTELTSIITSVIQKNGKDINFESQHIPYSDSFTNKYYNGMAIKSFDINEAATRMHKFLYE